MPTFPEFEILNSPIEPGLTVIEASAGAGKTYAISHVVPRMLLDGSLPDLSKLLLVTFTKDAARELAERVRRVLSLLSAPPTPDEIRKHPHVAALRPLLANAEARARLDRALLDLDLLAVSTIHAFCQRTLQQEGSLCGLPVLPEVTNDDNEFLAPIVREQWIATLSADAAIAALATALNWQLDSAIKFINAFRRALRPRTEPSEQPYATLRAMMTAVCESLASKAAFQSFADLLSQVQAWNGGIQNSTEILVRLIPLQTGKTETLAYWQSLAFAVSVPGKITARSKEAKALKANVTSHDWFDSLNKLENLVERLEWAWHQQLAAEALPKLAAVMAQHRLITQDGLIGALYQVLHRTSQDGSAQSARLASHLAERYHVALIDESQDTDPRQLAIFRRIFLDAAHKRRLIIVGDPKQAIYGFRGAELSTYLAARDAADAGYTLTHTYRAPQPLVETINSLFQRPQTFHNPNMMFRPATSALSFDRQLLRMGLPCSRLETWVVSDVDTEIFSAKGRRVPALSARIATTIVDLLQHGEILTSYLDGRTAENRQVTPSDFAVLVATNAQAEAMAEALQARAVPVVVNSGSDVFASEEARELHTLLHALLDPRRTRRLRSALATRLLGLNAAALASLDKLTASSQSLAVIWLERFMRWNQAWTNRGLAALLAELEHRDIGLTHRLAATPLTGERRATNYRQLTDLLLNATRNEAPRPAEIVRWLGQQIARAEERSQAEERQLQLSSDRKAVQIVTMHKAKGLEYPLVFCPYLAESLYESKGLAQISDAPTNGIETKSDLVVNLDLLEGDAKADSIQKLMASQLEERLRLAYVALTRAQVRLWICSYSGSPKFDLGSPLDWILRTDAEIITYPTYSDDWVRTAKTGRSTRHKEVLQALGAQPHDEANINQASPLITFREPPSTADNCYIHEGNGEYASPDLSALPQPVVPPSWRITSFSTLTKEKHAHGAPSALVEENSTPVVVPANLNPGIAAPAFLAAPAGAAVGTAVHDWIETWNMSPPDAAALTQHIKMARLPEPGDNQPTWDHALNELFSHLRLIRLPGCGETPLHELCPEPHGSEWHFHLPLAGSLSVRDLARCFAEHADIAHRPYADSLAALSDEQFRGLLQGFIDRLARQGPAWGVIDWKTNRLGLELSDYDGTGLLQCAMKEHYILQMHLYLVALRRYLRAVGLADHLIAGAWLVFLRAIAPGETRGVLHVNPPIEMLNALDELFAPANCAIP